MNLRPIITLILLNLLFIGLPCVAKAQGAPAWSEPILLTQPNKYGWFPAIATDAAGGTHIMWSSSVENYDLVMYTTVTNMSVPPNDIVALAQQDGGSEVTRPSLLVDKNGIIHMTYRYTSIYYAKAHVSMALDAASWSQPKLISGGYYSYLAQDSQGVLHLVYTDNVPNGFCSNCYQVFYVQSTNNGDDWTTARSISLASTGSAKPKLFIDPQDNLHVVWESGEGGGYGQILGPSAVLYSMSDDRGQTWTPPYQLAPSEKTTQDAMAKNIAIGIADSRQLVAVWLSVPDDQIQYRVSQNNGREWSEPKVIPNVFGAWSLYNSRLDDFDVATDSAGDMHLILVGRRLPDQPTMDLLHLELSGDTWLGPYLITSLDQGALEYPQIAMSNGNHLHAVWFVRPVLWGEHSGFNLQYSSLTLNRTFVAGEPLPPLAATPTLESISDLASSEMQTAPRPTLEAYLRIVSNQSVSVASLKTETDDIALLAMSLLPTLLLIAMVLLVQRGQSH